MGEWGSRRKEEKKNGRAKQKNRKGKKGENTVKIAMIGHKHIPSREGGIEVVVGELSTRMVKLGHSVTCFNRKRKHISVGEIEKLKEYKGLKIKEVFTIERKGLAAMTSSLFATLSASFSNFEVIHIHAEGPAFFLFIPKRFRKKVVVTIHGACGIMGSTREKPVKSRLSKNSVFYLNSNTEYNIKNICSDILKRFCYIPMLLRQLGRAFFCCFFQSRCYMIPE